MDDSAKDKESLISELERLRERNLLLTDLIENSTDMLYRMSLPEGRYEYVNSASAELFGYSPEYFYQSPLLIRKIISRNNGTCSSKAISPPFTSTR